MREKMGEMEEGEEKGEGEGEKGRGGREEKVAGKKECNHSPPSTSRVIPSQSPSNSCLGKNKPQFYC